MRRVFTLFAVAFAIIASFGSRESVAQTADSTGKFKVVHGTNLWNLSRKVNGDATEWHSIFDANFTAGILDSADIEVRTNGDTVVYLRPGDTILLRADAAERAPEIVAKTDAAQAAVAVTPVPTAITESSSGVSRWWLVFFIIAGTLAYRNWKYRGQVSDLKQESAARNRGSLEYQRRLANAEARLERAERSRQPAETFTDLEVRGLATGYRRQRTDDEGEGPSFISGGITSPETLVLALQRAAQIEGVRRNPDAPITPHTNYVFRRGRRGMIVSGTYSSLFSDGTELVRVIELDKPETHRIVWKATTVAPDGTEFDVYAEEVCANGMAVPVNAQGDLVWWVMPAQMQTHALPAHAIFIDPPAAEEPATPEPAPVEMVSVVAVTTPNGQTIYLPAGSTMTPAQIPASEMISPEQGSETASS